MSRTEVCSAVGQTADETYPISRTLHLCYEMKNSSIYVNSKVPVSGTWKYLLYFLCFIGPIKTCFYALQIISSAQLFISACNKKRVNPWLIHWHMPAQLHLTCWSGGGVKEESIQHCMSALCLWAMTRFPYPHTDQAAGFVSAIFLSIALPFWNLGLF